MWHLTATGSCKLGENPYDEHLRAHLVAQEPRVVCSHGHVPPRSPSSRHRHAATPQRNATPRLGPQTNALGFPKFFKWNCQASTTFILSSFRRMSTAVSLPNDVGPSHSASSLDPPSTPSSTSGSVRPKSEHRVSLGVLDSAKFRLSHDVGVPVPSSLSPSIPFRA
jgi:hypothetical protein